MSIQKTQISWLLLFDPSTESLCIQVNIVKITTLVRHSDLLVITRDQENNALIVWSLRSNHMLTIHRMCLSGKMAPAYLGSVVGQPLTLFGLGDKSLVLNIILTTVVL